MNNTYEWRDSSIFPEYYSVSEMGEVISRRTGKILKPGIDKDGYLYYTLCVNGIRKTIKAHRLVAMAFIENPENKPSIDHINGIKTDNRVSNLHWVTNKENSNNPITLPKLQKNAQDRLPIMFQKSIERNFGRKKTAVYREGELLGTFESQKLAAEYTNVSIGKVSQCMSGQKKSCKGYTFIQVIE